MIVKPARQCAAFTLIELLVVISILGILAALAVPAVKSWGKAESLQSATQQLKDDIHRARQLALSQRTTVYMVFLPANFWNGSYAVPNATAYAGMSPTNKDLVAKLFDKQLNSYTFISMRSVGDQPGRPTPRYLMPWRSLPDGNWIAQWKFMNVGGQINDPPPPALPVKRVLIVDRMEDKPFPFPTADSPTMFVLPCIAFSHLGQIASGKDEYIPLARGTLGHAYSPTKVPLASAPTATEIPPTNSIYSFNIVHVDWLTGRARIERPEMQ